MTDPCIDCKVAQPLGLIGRHYYVRCGECAAERDVKRRANRQAKLARLTAAIAAKKVD